ncbi:MAG: hypothetical protein EBS36_04890 [Actinobacteria bacterium]|nr:hypothetical protein [Actinomycetota bacterium]NBY15817.1 hypothetical protein [Actinomycetota bacterium]
MNLPNFPPIVILYRRWLAAILISVSILVMLKLIVFNASERLVVINKKIAAGEMISAADVESIRVNYIWPGAVTESTQIIGKWTVTNLDAGQPLNLSLLSARQTFDPKFPNAVKVTLPANSTGVELECGSRVDVYVKVNASLAKKVLSRALVLSGGPANLAGLGKPARGIALAVRPNQIASLANFGQAATFTFVTLPL